MMTDRRARATAEFWEGVLRGFRVWVILATVALVGLSGVSGAFGQGAAGVAGEYAGALGGLHLKLHLKADAGGGLSGTLDSPDQGAVGIACADFLLDGENLSFSVPAVHGSWKGTVGKEGVLAGTWDQGSPMPLKFAREAGFVAGKASPIDGVWLGTLTAGGSSLRIQVSFKSDRMGQEFGTGDSLDQGATGLELAHIVSGGGSLSFEVPSVKGAWSGKLSADGKTLIGAWTQGEALPLNFVRQATAATVKPKGPPSFDAAMAKVPVEQMQTVLDGDLAEVLRSGELAAGTGVGISIGVVEHGVRKVFTYGEAKPDSIFEIGSITKTFTGLMLAQMVEEKKVTLTEPVRELLPAGSVPGAAGKADSKSDAKAGGTEITLLDLATQHSGLPRMPDNFKPADEANPYADYLATDLYAFLSKNGLAKPKDAGFLYSNLGFGLLGQALADRAGIAYTELLRDEVTGPLGLNDTLMELSMEQRARFMPGHDEGLKPAHAWDLVAMAGAGAIRSTAGDMLTYLAAQLEPEKVKAAAGFGGSATVAKAIGESHLVRSGAMAGPRMNSSIALAWLYDVDSGTYWHNGETGGYSAYAFFNPLRGWAGVVLVNAAVSEGLTDKLGEHIRARLSGDRAVALGK